MPGAPGGAPDCQAHAGTRRLHERADGAIPSAHAGRTASDQPGRQRDGRIITETGAGELDDARVQDKVGLSISRIEMRAFRTTFDPKTGKGTLPVNVSIFAKNQFPAFLKAAAPAFEKKLCVSSLSPWRKKASAWEMPHSRWEGRHSDCLQHHYQRRPSQGRHPGRF